MLKQQIDILVEKQRILKEIAESSDCVIVGRAADVILAGYRPLRIFVYADMQHRIRRCRDRAAAGENLSRSELKRSIRRVDAGRREYLKMFGDTGWGDKENYDLCVNTTGADIKGIAPHIAGYAGAWFQQ